MTIDRRLIAILIRPLTKLISLSVRILMDCLRLPLPALSCNKTQSKVVFNVSLMNYRTDIYTGLHTDFTTEILSQVIRQQIAGNTGNTANDIDFPSSLKKNCDSYGKARKVIGYYIRFRMGRLFIIQQI